MTPPPCPAAAPLAQRRLRRALGPRWRARLLFLAAALALLVPARISDAQERVSPPAAAELAAPAPPERAGDDAAPAPSVTAPLADPVLDAPAELRGNRATAWESGDTRFVLLEGEVTAAVGTYGFRARRALVRIDTERRPGRVIRHLMMDLEDARPLRGRGRASAEAPRLLVTASTTGEVVLATNLLLEGPAHGAFTAEAQRRFDEHLARLAAAPIDPPPPAPAMTGEEAARREARRAELERELRQRTEAALAEAARPVAPAQREAEAPVGDDARILPARGIVTYSADRVVFDAGENAESTLVLMGNVRVMYQSFAGGPGATLTAENAVIFLAPAEELQDLAERRMQAGDVRGVYLEENVVATYDDYTVRAPRVFYDLALNKAVVLDAVLYTWDERQNIPLYVRAERLRQESRNAWSARRAVVTTSEFAVPHFSIAAREVTFRQETNEHGLTVPRYTVRDTTFRVGRVPLFYWPYVAGTAQDVALRNVSLGYNDDDGVLLKTTWEPFSLLGRPTPEGVDASLKLDYLGQHGPAVGLSLQYDRPRMFGELDSYWVPDDRGDFDVGDRNTVDHDGESRGFALLRHRWLLPDNWDLSLETAWVSDPVFLEQYFRNEAERSKPYETSLHARKQEDDWAFTLLARYDLIDFVPQTTVLQYQPYNVDKMPELSYYRIGTSLWEDRLTYYSETRVGRLRIRGDESSPADRGFTDVQSAVLSGLPDAGTTFDTALDAAGVPDGWVHRLDTRHEVQMPMRAGMVDVVPYVGGRFTGYDEDFDEFTDGDGDPYRLWGTAGLRLHTSFTRSYDDAESPLLDVHRLRHIIEPSAHLFTNQATTDAGDFPVYDPQVEGIQDGSGFRVGVRNTLQTQRGGPGRWRSVDWLVVDTDFVSRSDDTPAGDPIARLIDYRPEYSTGGDHFHGNVGWMISDNVAAAASFIHNLETDDLVQWRVGATLQHSPVLRSFIEYTELEPLDSQLLDYGFSYQLTRKYNVAFRHTFDLSVGQSRSIDLTLIRKLPRWRLVFLARHDPIDDDNTFAVVLVPDGVNYLRTDETLGNNRLTRE